MLSCVVLHLIEFGWGQSSSEMVRSWLIPQWVLKSWPQLPFRPQPTASNWNLVKMMNKKTSLLGSGRINSQRGLELFEERNLQVITWKCQILWIRKPVLKEQAWTVNTFEKKIERTTLNRVTLLKSLRVQREWCYFFKDYSYLHLECITIHRCGRKV